MQPSSASAFQVVHRNENVNVNKAAQQAADAAYLAGLVYEHPLILILLLVFRLTFIPFDSAEFDILENFPEVVLYQVDE